MSTTTPILHVVPNGVHITPNGSGHTLRLLLLLLPGKHDNSTAPKWPIAQWPSKSHVWLEGLTKDGREVTLHYGRSGQRIAVGKIKAATQPVASGGHSRLDELWFNALGGAASLAELLDAATTFDAHCSTGSAIPAPTLEASLLLPLERARAALETVGGAHSPLVTRAPARPSMKALAAIGRPWLGATEPMVQLAAAGAGVLDSTLARLLVGPPDVADWLAQCDGCGADEAHPYSRPLDPDAIAAAVLGRGEEDLLWLSDRLHSLHHAALHLAAADDAGLPPQSGAGGRRLHQLLASPALMRLFGWAHDVLLELRDPLPPDESAVLCALAPDPRDPVHKPVASVLDISARSFFPAAKMDWQRLKGGQGTEPWAQSGLRVLTPASGPRVCASSIEPTLCTEADHQCQIHGRATRLVTGPLSLFPLGNANPGKCDSADTLLFATDLAAPSRLYLGIDSADGNTTWWPTSARTVSLLDPWAETRDEGWLNPVLRGLTPPWMPASERDAAGVTSSTEFQNVDENGAAGRTCVDPRIAAYHGDDLGAPANELTPSEMKGQPIRWQPDEVSLGLGQDIFVGQRISVSPDADLAPLFFGWSYRVAVDERVLGGGGPSLAHVREVLARPDSALVWPPRSQPGFRYLRHEPIAKPTVLLAPGTRRDGGLENKLQTSERMVIVRAATPRPGDARSLARTSRILLVPSVACAFAARHDVFDGQAERTEIRMQNADGRWVTVPVTIPRQGLPEAVIEGDGATVSGTDVKLPPRFRVRRLGEPREIRQSPYYPDPAAALLVLRLAHPDHGGWLDDPPLVLRLRPPIESRGPSNWPDVMPVRLDLVAADRTAPRRLVDSGLGEALAPVATSGPYAGATPPGVRLRVATVTLAPGEAVKLHAWLVPDATDLAAWFDAVEQAAALARAEGAACGASGAGAALAGLTTLLGGRACADGPAVDAAAASFHAHMLAEPLLEIADTVQVDLIHACDTPSLPPAFVSGTAGLARPESLEPAKLARFLGESGRAETWGEGAAAADEATILLPGGAITFDQATTDELVVEAELVAPGRETLDAEPRALPPQLAPLPAAKLPFRLTTDGAAHFGWPDDLPPRLPQPSGPTLRPRWVELLRITHIPAPADARAGRRELRLEELIIGSSPDFAGASVAFLNVLEQPQARRARLRVRALPRSAALITAAPPKPAPSAPFPSDRALKGPPTNMLWAPATSRPAPVATKDLVPMFDWPPLTRRRDGAGITIEGERLAGLRLWLRRPWFTSGEGERLGVVFWPPPAFAQMDDETAAFTPDDQALHGLHEDDLGPLGRFVSVWGYDPLGAGPPAPLAPPPLPSGRANPSPIRTPAAPPPARWDSSFLARPHIQLGPEARFHPHVLMPVPGQMAPESLATPRETMAAVSVLSVPVRFEHEFPPPHDAGPDAYVDLTMRLPTPHDALFRLGLVRLQEHARPDRRGAPREGARAGIRLSAPASIQGSVPPPRRFGVSVTLLDTRHGATGAISLVGVTLAGPAAADGRGVASRRVRMELRERRGNEELPVTDQDGRDAALLWVGGEARPGIEHRAFGGEERWTGVFRVPGDVLREGRDIVARIEEEAWLPPSRGGVPSVALLRFPVTVPLLEGR
jgi:hypothetical protein